ncbi:MAG TPA: sugar phosphate isomerase/epimerase family protein [Gaiellaceae bacterium]|nr:sugar phosphate isomerase/epimerase family protein [Gaiellaceae bacterium]
MKIGCFALIDPFSVLEHQLQRIAGLGFDRADVTDNGDGAVLGVHFGFTAVASLDANPYDLARMFEAHGLTITSYCAHANLLDPTAPWRYGTSQIIKAVRAAATIGIPHVITTDGDPTTPFGEQLTPDQALFTIAEKLYEPLRVAADHGVKILLEPHGPVTGSIDKLEQLLELCDSPALALNLDTGNLWLAGDEPVDMVRRLGGLIEHVHWKDVPEEMAAERGTRFGFGMSTIALGTGLVDIAGTAAALAEIGFDGDTTLEIAGDEAVLASRHYLDSLASVAVAS